jgi:predicted AAA+ superfamily ATPase
MPHKRYRLGAAAIAKSLKHSPIVGILGQRQTGKTTLMKEFAKKDSVSLDDFNQLEAARSSPRSFLNQSTSLLGIDECQLAPELFPSFKLHVGEHPRPGQFLITGSVRFTSRKLIRESLTGRIVTHELLPLCLPELDEYAPPNAFEMARASLASLRNLLKHRKNNRPVPHLLEFLQTGGLPGICFFRDKSVREERFSAHLDTLLRRDIQLVHQTSLSYEKLRKVLAALASQQGMPLNISAFSRQCRTAAATTQKALIAFEALFLIRRLLPLGDGIRDAFFLEDQGMATYLNRNTTEEADYLRLAFSQLFAQHRYLTASSEPVSYYTTRGGANVPLVFSSGGEMTGFIPLASENVDQSAKASAESFLRKHRQATVVILTKSDEVVDLAPHIRVMPYGLVL